MQTGRNFRALTLSIKPSISETRPKPRVFHWTDHPNKRAITVIYESPSEPTRPVMIRPAFYCLMSVFVSYFVVTSLFDVCKHYFDWWYIIDFSTFQRYCRIIGTRSCKYTRAPKRLKSLAIRLFVQQLVEVINTGNVKPRIPSWWKSTNTRTHKGPVMRKAFPCNDVIIKRVVCT